MPAETPTPVAPTSDRVEALYDALLYVVSHDVKSPLVSITLGAELLETASSGGEETARVALDAIRHGAKDLERQLEAVTVISRARRRPLDDTPRALGALLAEIAPLAAPALEGVTVAVDPRPITELLAVSPDPATIEVDVRPSEVRLVLSLPEDTTDLEGSPLELLLGSLTVHAGGTITALAGLEAQLERQGGALQISGARMRLTLPRIEAGR
ncbi:MAG: hypothetical protein R3C39_02385 [Dehalococcoidia bacterium]